MGLLSHRVKKSNLQPGDHVYTWRAAFTYSHHGIYVGLDTIVHFTPNSKWNISGYSSCSTSCNTSCSSSCNTNPKTDEPSYPTYADCGCSLSRGGVVLSCIDHFIGSGSLYLFDYGVSKLVLLSKIRSSTCTTAKSDPPEEVLHRAMYLHRNGFGSYDVARNNCEDFALYCKTGLLVVGSRLSSSQVHQAAGFIKGPLVSYATSALMLTTLSPVSVATVTAAMCYRGRVRGDIGIRSDVTKVDVENVAARLNS